MHACKKAKFGFFRSFYRYRHETLAAFCHMCADFFPVEGQRSLWIFRHQKREKREREEIFAIRYAISFKAPFTPPHTHTHCLPYLEIGKGTVSLPSFFPRKKRFVYKSTLLNISPFEQLDSNLLPPPTASPPDVTPFPIKAHLQKSFSIRASHTCVVERKGNSKTYFHLSFF